MLKLWTIFIITVQYIYFFRYRLQRVTISSKLCTIVDIVDITTLMMSNLFCVLLINYGPEVNIVEIVVRTMVDNE